MSSISDSLSIEILRYWSKKKIPHKLLFLITKFIEIKSFKKNAIKSPSTNNENYTTFPHPVKNNVTKQMPIAIVIPSYIKNENELKQIYRLLKNLISEQSIQADKIILVDDASPMHIDVSNFPEILQYRRIEKNSGPATARNIGIDEALKIGCGIIAFTDSDCIPSNTWIEEIKNFFVNNDSYNIVSGKTISYGNKWFDLYHNINGTLNGRKFKNSNHLLYGTTANLAITSRVAKKLRFDINFPCAASEDIDFCLQANKLGFYIGYNNKMLIKHDFAYTSNIFANLDRFKKQFIRYAKGEKILLQKNPEYYIYFNDTEEITSL